MTLLFLLACGAQAETTTLTVKGQTVTVELADAPSERTLGLMYRERLGADDGMLFVYPEAEPRSFWMKDTKLPLSIAFLDAAGRIVHLADMRPLDSTPVPSGKPAMYALEVNQGWFAAHGIAVGDTVTGLPPASAR